MALWGSHPYPINPPWCYRAPHTMGLILNTMGQPPPPMHPPPDPVCPLALWGSPTAIWHRHPMLWGRPLTPFAPQGSVQQWGSSGAAEGTEDLQQCGVREEPSAAALSLQKWGKKGQN